MESAMSTVQEDADLLRKLLRKACNKWGGSMPQDIQDWWVAEQDVMAIENATKTAEKAAKVADLQARIADLNAKLATLV